MQWDHPEPRSAHPATLQITPSTEVTVMPKSVTQDGRGWKIFVQHGDAPLESRLLFGSDIEHVKQYIQDHPEYFS